MAEARRRVLFLFVDGVGVGPDDPATNPLAAAELPALRALLGARPVAPEGPAALPFAPLDACLGVPGRPQSATGQTALLTGLNAPALLGRHMGPYPGAALRPLLEVASLWRRLADAERTTALANAFPDRYLDRVAAGGGRMGAIARSAQMAGVRLRGPEDLRAGTGVSAFLTNEGWREHLGYEGLPEITEAEAGANLAAVASHHDFTLFEHYATDIAGHQGGMEAAVAALERYDRFLAGVLAAWPADDVLVLAADHGNVEDQRTHRHTLNPALGAWRGPAPSRPLASLVDIAPAILEALGVPAHDALADEGAQRGGSADVPGLS